MSLVSYADSGDSSDNDSGGESNEQTSRNVVVINKVEVKNHDAIISKEELRRKASSKDDTQPEESEDNSDEKIKPKSIGNLFSSLPAPWKSSATWASQGKSEKKRQQTVKISLPVAEESDSDDEVTEKQERKHISGSQKPSGLSSLLPKPKHSVVVKENNPNRPVTKISNRPLIPVNLRRKQAQKSAQTRHKIGVKKHDSDDEEDEEDQESVGFFSFGEQEHAVGMETNTGNSQDENLGVGSAVSDSWNTGHIYDTPPVDVKDTSATANTYSTDVDKRTKQDERNDTLTSQLSYSNTPPDPSPVQHSMNVEPADENAYSYGESSLETTTTYYGNNGEPNAEYQDYSYTGPESYYNYSHDQYNQSTQQAEYDTGKWNAEPTVQNTFQQPVSASDNAANNDDIQLKKRQGKRGRGEENINIIDVNADDQVGPTSEWKSRYQRQDAEYKPQSKKKENLPSSQQRRKHQITYLAFQAKESEWELRNQWATNSQTRRQTQSKYGF